MNRLNWLFTATSLSVLLVTAERFSFTTRVLLQPHDFLRLHELVQMVLLILATAVIPTMLLREVSRGFAALTSRAGLWLLLTFVVGVYYYSTGNGVHELASFTFNTYCAPDQLADALCGGLFFNDYFTGNVLYFVGAFLMNVALLLFERQNPNESFRPRHLPVLLANAVLYAFAVFAYGAFDRVLVGLVYTVVMALFAIVLLWPVRRRFAHHPVITYTTVGYVLAALASVVVRVAR
jgi:hypothetical protein